MAALIICGPACAKSTCADIHGEQSFPSLKMSDGVVCFVKEPVVDPGTRTPIGVDAISLYYIANGGDAAKAEGRGLLYDNTPGEIMDAFPAKISPDRSESIFVIHSIDLPPANRASRSLVKFVFGEEDEHEEALYGTANHRVSEGSRGR
ncbi:hypothetical protein LGN12_28615, partial [Burkholderia multivorans]|nr:hypothetical protein [Burkholderia multivorans]